MKVTPNLVERTLKDNTDGFKFEKFAQSFFQLLMTKNISQLVEYMMVVQMVFLRMIVSISKTEKIHILYKYQLKNNQKIK